MSRDLISTNLVLYTGGGLFEPTTWQEIIPKGSWVITNQVLDFMSCDSVVTNKYPDPAIYHGIRDVMRYDDNNNK